MMNSNIHFVFLFLYQEHVVTQDISADGYLNQDQGENRDDIASEQLIVGCQEGLDYMKFLKREIRYYFDTKYSYFQ